MRKTLVLDCDGVLYPLSAIPNAEFVQAFKDTIFSLGIGEEQYQEASTRAKAKKALGLFNFAREICQDFGVSFEAFCDGFVAHLNYKNITRDDELLELIYEVQKYYNLAIYTNNHIKHLNKILEAKFCKNTSNIGFICYDITSTYFNNIFHPKKSDLGLRMVAEKLGQEPADCILVDDAEFNCAKALSIGMEAVLITENFTLKDYLRGLLKKVRQ